MDLNKLLDPFPAADIEWRISRAGEKDGKMWAIVLAYVTNRAIMERLDNVVGPGNWKNQFDKGPDGGVICGISIRMRRIEEIVSDAEVYTMKGKSSTITGLNYEWVTKWDGAGNTDFEAIKGGLSGSMKRAAVQWGIGRYLYNLDETFVNHDADGDHRDYIITDKQKKARKLMIWKSPELPEWALPKGQSFYDLLAEVQKLKAGVDEIEYYKMLIDIKNVDHSNKLSMKELEVFKAILDKIVQRNERFMAKMGDLKKKMPKHEFSEIAKELNMSESFKIIKDKNDQIRFYNALETWCKKNLKKEEEESK